MRDFLPSLIMATFVIAVIMFVELTPPNSGAVIAVLGPNTTLRETVNKTDAFLVRQGEIPNSYVLYSKAPDFPARLRQAGALLVLNSEYTASCTTNATVAAPSRFSAPPTID